MNTKQEFTQEEIMERAKENSDTYYEELKVIGEGYCTCSWKAVGIVEESFYW